MTTPARQAEADRVELVYYWALNQVGNLTVDESRIIWQDVPATAQAATNASWLATAIQLVMLRRSKARRLALAYFRLVRALRTGYTVALPGEDDGGTTSLDQLRDEFEAIVDDIDSELLDAGLEEPAPDPTPETPEPASEELELTPDPAPTEEPEYDPDEGEDDDSIYLEELAELDAIIEAEERAAEQEAAEVLDQLGIENMLQKIEQVDEQQAADKADAERAEAHRQAGNRQAAAAARISMNAARGLVYDLSETDQRVLGWVRYSQTGTPCGWCAMLLSREVFYKSKSSASLQGDASEFDQYHDNCRCVAVPIFLPDQYRTSDLFRLNREYLDLWNKNIKGRYSGDLALSKWRRLIRDKQQAEAQTQAAA